MEFEIVSGIVKAIRSKYLLNDYAVYTEAVEQGMKIPCFFVFQLTQNERKILKNRYQKNTTYVIQYISKSRNKRKEYIKVAEELYSILEILSVGECEYRGTGMRCEIRENVLHFFVDYNYFVIKPKEKDVYMEEVEVYGKTRTDKGKRTNKGNKVF